MFATPFSVDVKDGPSNNEMELTEMQCNTDLREKFMNEGAVELNSRVCIRVSVSCHPQ